MKVVCTSLDADSGPHFGLLAEAGFDVLRVDRTRNYENAEELIAELQGCCAVIAGSEPYSRQVIEALPELRVIARTGVGFDSIDLQACDERGVVVSTTPGVNHHSVAELTIAMLMAVARGFPDRDQQVRAGIWKRAVLPRVSGRVLGLVGLGRIGQAVATRAVGLGMNVIASDPFPPGDFIRDWQIEIVEFPDLLPRADFVSLHSPLLPHTRHLMNAETFARMKPGAVLINTARGGLVDEAALVSALKAGPLSGAALDVFEIEPLPLESPLLGLPNVLLSGHVAGLDQESQRDSLSMAASTILALHAGEWPGDCIQNLRERSGWRWER